MCNNVARETETRTCSMLLSFGLLIIYSLVIMLLQHGRGLWQFRTLGTLVL